MTAQSYSFEMKPVEKIIIPKEERPSSSNGDLEAADKLGMSCSKGWCLPQVHEEDIVNSKEDSEYLERNTEIDDKIYPKEGGKSNDMTDAMPPSTNAAPSSSNTAPPSANAVAQNSSDEKHLPEIGKHTKNKKDDKESNGMMCLAIAVDCLDCVII